MMPCSDIYLYSPLSTKNVQEGNHSSLLIQFILSEIFQALRATERQDSIECIVSSPICLFPYDWSYQVGCLNKIKEHATLLYFGFPLLNTQIDAFCLCLEETWDRVSQQKQSNQRTIDPLFVSQLSRLYLCLKPFLFACQSNEEVLLFLLQHTEEIEKMTTIDELPSFFNQMFPEGIYDVVLLIRKAYRDRGFNTLMPEIDQLLSHYAC